MQDLVSQQTDEILYTEAQRHVRDERPRQRRAEREFFAGQRERDAQISTTDERRALLEL